MVHTAMLGWASHHLSNQSGHAMKPKALPLVGTVSDRPFNVGTAVTLLSVVVADTAVRLDIGALRGESEPERGITFSDNASAAPEGRLVWIVWVSVRAGVTGRDGYFSAVASPLRIDAKRKTGFRPPTHFTDMIGAIQGTVRLQGLSEAQIHRLGEALAAHDTSMWEERSEALRHIWPNN